MYAERITQAAPLIGHISMADNQPSSLDELMLQAWAQQSEAVRQEQQAVLQRIQRPEAIADPAELISLQQRVTDYNFRLQLISTLTHKGTSAVETLLRA